MKKFFGTVAVLVAIIVGLSIWGKEKIVARIWPEAIKSPLFQQPTVYDLLALLEKNGLTVSDVPILQNGTIQASISGMIVMFTANKDLFAQVRSLQLLLPRLKMDDRIVKEIDLRFNKVVLRY